ncbi:MFS transporter [Corynebacterium sp. KPL2830]|uniref:MFS transporter n=1 Tax=unclassified Corynebacterium TaxID=2624378 RepID=UPI00042A7E90|nr:MULTISPECIES: MFS transporter [unclassified Corynebacterium]
MTGKIADAWGRKRAFLTGLTIFVAGSVLAGFSTTAATLISARCAGYRRRVHHAVHAFHG